MSADASAGRPRATTPKNLLEVATTRQWRAWLSKHHATETEVWLVYWRKASGKPRIPYNEAVEEALCFGWIDGQQKEAATRKSLIGSGDRSERIRTYNFPQGRITDHRINLTLYKIDAITDGDLFELTDSLAREHQAEQLAAMSGETA